MHVESFIVAGNLKALILWISPPWFRSISPILWSLAKRHKKKEKDNEWQFVKLFSIWTSFQNYFTFVHLFLLWVISFSRLVRTEQEQLKIREVWYCQGLPHLVYTEPSPHQTKVSLKSIPQKVSPKSILPKVPPKKYPQKPSGASKRLQLFSSCFGCISSSDPSTKLYPVRLSAVRASQKHKKLPTLH